MRNRRKVRRTTSKPLSDFDYDILHNQKILLLYDRDLGGMSLTNDIENAVKFIADREAINLSEYKIAYKDSMKRFDAVIINKNTGGCKIYFLGTTTREETIARLGKVVEQD